MTQKFTILLDLDGTILDTAPDIMGAHNHVMKKFGFEERQLKDLKYLAGRGAAVMIQRSLAKQGDEGDKKKVEDMKKEFLDYYAKNINNKSEPIDGVIDFFKWSKKNNIALAVCTNKLEKLAVDLLKKKNWLDYFYYVAGADTFDYNKPDPRHLTDVVDIIGGDLKKTIMVGDSEVDSLSAENANLPFVLVEAVNMALLGPGVKNMVK